jgi:AmpD protein
MQINGGWLDVAQQRVSPNCDDRPDGLISLIVIHGISLPAGHFGTHYVHDLFLNQLNLAAHPDFHDLRDVCVSSHLLLRRDGQIEQFVPFHKRAWHAGLSSFKGRAVCNDYSIGIELEGTDISGYRPEQYRQLVQVCQCMMAQWQIPLEHIVGHCDIAPGRKTDPGAAFDWVGFRAALAEPVNG